MIQKADSGWRRKENTIAYWMMTPGLILYATLVLLPMLWVIYISFTAYDGVSKPKFIGLENYFYAFKDSYWWTSVLNTFIFAFFKVLIEAPLALILAVILNRRLKGAAWFRTIFFMPHLMSLAVMGVIFYFLLRPFEGVVNGILQMLRLIDTPVDFLGNPVLAMGSIILIGIWGGFGINMVYFLAGLQTIPQELYESAEMDGATETQKMINITIPMLGPVFKIVIMLMIVFTLKTFDIVKVLTDGGPYGKTEIMFTYIFHYFFNDSSASPQHGYGSALGVLAAVIIGIVSIFYLKVSKNTKSAV